MQRFGEETARVFKLLAGQDRDEPVAAHVSALYTILLMAGLILVAAWITAP
jgi:hypothetical protein